MGNVPSVDTTQLPQDPVYIRHCQQQPKEFNRTLHIDLATLKGAWVASETLGHAEISPKSATQHHHLESGGLQETSDPNLYSEIISTTFHMNRRKAHQPVLLGRAADNDNNNNNDNNNIHSSTVNIMESVDFGDSNDHRLVEDSLMLAAAASCGKIITHILDGYSWGLITRISTDQHRHTYITVALAPVPDDLDLQASEEAAHRQLKFGMFTKGNIPWYQWLFCCGRTMELATTGQVIERRTAHQPIFFPPLNQAYFASSGSWPAFDVHWPSDEPDVCKAQFQPNSYAPQAWLRDFLGKWRYVCMHPQYDYHSNKLLTYTFKHATTSRKTNMKFYEFDGSGNGNPLPSLPKALPNDKGYTMYDRVALHMFGFTKRYFVVFANSLQLKQAKTGSVSGTCSLTCGVPIMRALNPDYCGDLIIHFVPRPGFTNVDGFIINTKCQGNVYHTINCFDEELENGDWTGRVVVDAFVSKLNAQRESAQFELNPNDWVFDNEGEPFRFVVDSPAVPNKKSPCSFQAIASSVDSTIDFHCINPKFNGVRHQYSYMVSHTRHRNDKGDISWVESRLIKIDVSFSELNPLNYDPDKTVQRVVHSPSWQDPNSSKPLSCYLRTPLFVSRQDAKFEDDGHLFSWSFDTEPNSTEQSGLRAYILMFDARNLDLIMRVPMPDDLVVPYSVHSAIFARNPLPLQAAPLNEEDWENSKTILK